MQTPDLNTLATHSILFTGHMIDRADRAVPRFPAVLEDEVKQKILFHIQAEQARIGEGILLTAIASGACGGDVIFHESCISAGVPSVMYLPKDPGAFVHESVDFAGTRWVKRFDHLYEHLPHIICTPEMLLPPLLNDGSEHDVWSFCNLVMLADAMKEGGEHMTLIALWNGQGGDGPGGTAHLVSTAQRLGAAIIVIDI
ncbi:MAG: hypothetical protein EOP49_42895 [Sphingobacteriales bacterium]|nr:MAG: hypothetical protein EOP49_42895 [Sphingobacteriales bacterium]